MVSINGVVTICQGGHNAELDRFTRDYGNIINWYKVDSNEIYFFNIINNFFIYVLF